MPTAIPFSQWKAQQENKTATSTPTGILQSAGNDISTLFGGAKKAIPFSQWKQNNSSPDAKSASQYNPSFPYQSGASPASNVARAVGNVPSSFVNFIKNLGTAIMHPIKTSEGLGSAIIGGSEEGFSKLLGKNDSNPDQYETAFNSLASALKNRYGSLDNLTRTSVNDPFGLGADIFAILSGGATIADTFSGASKLNAATDAARASGASAADLAGVPAKAGASGALDTAVSTVAKPVTSIPKVLGNATSQLLGAGTGAGASSVKTMFSSGANTGSISDAATAAMRGKTTPESVVQTAQDAVQTIADNRRTAYMAQLKDIGGNTKSLDISPIQTSVQKNLANFGIKINEDGTLDFSRSSIANNGTARADIQGIYDTVKNWGTQSGDRTAIGLDTLKKQLADFYSPSGGARAFVQSVKGVVSNILSKQVPGYSDMTRGYQEVSDLLDEIKSATGVGTNSNIDTVFSKLTNAMRSDNQLRLDIIKQMTNAGDESDLEDKIAGINMKSLVPKGLFGKGVDFMAITGLFGGILKPETIAIMLSSSPRIVGEFVHALGVSSNYATKLANFINKVAKAASIAVPVASRTSGLQDAPAKAPPGKNQLPSKQ
jgi:hypothetical protein